MRYFLGFETLVAELSRCVSAAEHLIEEGQLFLEVLLDPSSRGLHKVTLITAPQTTLWLGDALLIGLLFERPYLMTWPKPQCRFTGNPQNLWISYIHEFSGF